MNKKNIENEIIKSIKSPELTNLAEKYAEIGIDAIMSEGFLKDIPIVGSIISIGKLGVNISNVIFVKKLIRFLVSLDSIDENERSTLIDKLNNEDEFKKKVGERVL